MKLELKIKRLCKDLERFSEESPEPYRCGAGGWCTYQAKVVDYVFCKKYIGGRR